jgi:hypothetical protein
MVIVALVLVSPLVEAGHARATDGDATLAIHRRVCPPGVSSDLYNACHALPQRPGVTISLNGAEKRRARTDGPGNVLFDNLTPGVYFAGDNTPGGDFTRHHVFCSEADNPGVYRPAGLAAIMLAAGESVVCDWYITNPDMTPRPDSDQDPAPTPTSPPPLPTGTTVMIASWICPSDYVNSNYGKACRQHPGAGFHFWARHVNPLNTPVTGPTGTVELDLAGLPTKTIVIATLPPDGSRQFYASIVDCHAGENRLEVRPLDTLAGYTMIAVPVSPAEQIQCDWYNVPYSRS